MGSRRPVDNGAEVNKGWLATSFGCCAPRSAEKQDLEDLEEAARQTRTTIHAEQPQPVAVPRAQPQFVTARPNTGYSTKSLSNWMVNGWDAASKVSTRPSFSTLRPRTAESKILISGPTDFRRVDGVGAPRRRREEFRPLELSIYLPHNRLSPLPDFNKSDWTAKLPELEMPRPAMLRPHTDPLLTFSSNDFTVQRKPIRSTMDSPNIPRSNRSSLTYAPTIQSDALTLQTQLPTVPSRARSSPLLRSDTQGSSRSGALDIVRAMSPTSPRARAASDPPAHTRKRSNQSRGGRSDIDEAIRELNTIVEERRADARSTPTRPTAEKAEDDEESGDHSPVHVPAIAPSMKMRVRTETLSSIGSGLSTPHTKVFSPPPPLPLERHHRQWSESTYATNDLFDEDNLLSPPSRSSTRTRLTQWLRTSFGEKSPPPTATQHIVLDSNSLIPPPHELPPETPPYFQTSHHKNTNAHPLYSCPPTTPPPNRQSFDTVTVSPHSSPHSSVQSDSGRGVKTTATSVTEVEMERGKKSPEYGGKKSFETGSSIFGGLEGRMRAGELKEMGGFSQPQVTEVGLAY
ncbi:MAG: hypothetical protein M1820_008461 [Bogoriella megaspora]|nr:MAG: hypothetical protein M1820_008461 [Bogoriella megaspora]